MNMGISVSEAHNISMQYQNFMEESCSIGTNVTAKPPQQAKMY
jgi:hypothetical protein